MLTDAELAAALRHGSNDAFTWLYERYRSRIFLFCVRMTKDRTAAEDIVQDTFLKARASVAALQNGAALGPWLFSIARNEVLMRLRRTSRAVPLAEEEHATVFDEHTPLDVAIASETGLLVRRMIETLKPDYREVLLLREYEDLCYRDIALITGSSEQAVKSRLFKARKALAQRLRTIYNERKNP